MGAQKLNDDEFKNIIEITLKQASPSELYNQWTGYKRGAEKLKTEHRELLSQGKIDEANKKNRAILQAEAFAKRIEESEKFKRFMSN